MGSVISPPVFEFFPIPAENKGRTEWCYSWYCKRNDYHKLECQRASGDCRENTVSLASLLSTQPHRGWFFCV